MKKVLLAFQFLTIIPVTGIKDVSEKDIGSASAFFPVVGVVQGLIFAVSAGIFLKVFNAELSNGLVLLVMVLTSGGLHLDGLSDTFDAVASTGDREKKLQIMKDSTIGPIGVIAIVIVLLLKYILLNALFSNSTINIYYLSLLLMPVFSRWTMVTALFHARTASQHGLGKTFIEHTGLKQLLIATFITVLVFMSALLITSKFGNRQLSIVNCQFVFILPLLYIFSLMSLWFFNRRFGGATGDNFGAVSELSEILFLIMAIICIQNFI
ncbi:MAG TPA: adenosylcobinamide-GDP ribazoletransferase [Nitrospirae bacterium]|nr:cobalamin synthase [bacterium BMS3Bbin08]HDH00374.1 adenosylcobinamide-GDP ribazoletransferase [Nitrospirota bacterium]